MLKFIFNIFLTEIKSYMAEQNTKTYKTEEEIEQNISSELRNGINNLDIMQDFEIFDVLKTDLSAYSKQSDKKATEKKEATKVGNMRVAKKEHHENPIVKELKEQGVKQSDLKKAVEEHDKKISELKELAQQIEAKNNYLKFSESLEDIKKFREFLFTTNLFNEEVVLNKEKLVLQNRASQTTGVEENLFINSYDIIAYNNKDSPKDGAVDPAEQLVLLGKLNKLFGFEFIQQTDSNLKFGDVDRSICAFLKARKPQQHKIVSNIVQHMLKKILICSMGQMESAFRSDSVWITPEFKRVILPEIIMMQALPENLKNSFNIFVEELTELKDPRILKDSSKLDYLIHTATNGIIEQTLARAIKCMTPMFIYDYFEAVKSVYLFAGMLEVLLSEKTRETLQRIDILLLGRVALFVYQNSRYLQNSLPRNLPLSNEELSEQLQMYYLNHTMLGPQNILLRMMEKACVSII